MKRIPDFFNKFATEFRATYFANENHGYTNNTNYWKTTKLIEDFSNNCLTYKQFCEKLSKVMKVSIGEIKDMVSKYYVDEGVNTDIVRVNKIYLATILAERRLNSLVETMTAREYEAFFPEGLEVENEDEDSYYTEKAQETFDFYYNQYLSEIEETQEI